MRLDGVNEVQTDIAKNEVTVTYDDTKINYAKMAAALAKNYFPPTGEPRYLKSPDTPGVQGPGLRGTMPVASSRTPLNSHRQESFCRVSTH